MAPLLGCSEHRGTKLPQRVLVAVEVKVGVALLLRNLRKVLAAVDNIRTKRISHSSAGVRVCLH